MKKLLFAFLMCFALTSYAAPLTEEESQAISYRLNFYATSGFKPDEIATLMGQYFMNKRFEARYDVGSNSFDIVMFMDEDTENAYMQTIGTLPNRQ